MTARPASNRDHWLSFHFDEKRERQVVDGCHCGFKADVENDEGWGDTVVDHLLRVGALNQIERTESFMHDELDNIEADLMRLARHEPVSAGADD